MSALGLASPLNQSITQPLQVEAASDGDVLNMSTCIGEQVAIVREKLTASLPKLEHLYL
jgi:hypothetical protein